MKARALLFAFASLAVLAGCGVQDIPRAKNDVEAKTANLTSEYKRRADLVPQLIGAVSGNAKHEKDTLEAVVKARASATSITLDPANATPDQLRAYQNAQGQLSQALGRLMMVTENYPDLKANDAFLDLQAQLEGTENRIKIARQDLITSIQAFNDLVTVFPDSLTNQWMYHYAKMPQWDVDADEKQADEKAPKVQF
ncbi:MAG TPA: LemA family protein [bacterium]|jgi:LemA protein|nr:LemA family protein [bacterium]